MCVFVSYLGVGASDMLHHVRDVSTREKEVLSSFESGCLGLPGRVDTERVCQAVTVLSQRLDHV